MLVKVTVEAYVHREVALESKGEKVSFFEEEAFRSTIPCSLFYPGKQFIGNMHSDGNHLGSLFSFGVVAV